MKGVSSVQIPVERVFSVVIGFETGFRVGVGAVYLFSLARENVEMGFSSLL